MNKTYKIGTSSLWRLLISFAPCHPLRGLPSTPLTTPKLLYRNKLKFNFRYNKIIFFFIIHHLLFTHWGFCKELIIFHASSLAKPLEEIGEAFNKRYPDIKIMREASGSRKAAFKIAHLNRECDLFFSADYKLMEEILIPQHTNWYFIFARGEMVVAYADWSRYASEITSENWYDILTREGVQIGRSHEDLDPCGYRALMVWQLAEDFYNIEGLMDKLNKNCPKENIRPKSIALIPQIQSLDVDYIFQYLSLAVQHRLPFIELPKEINLGHFEYKDFYKRARVKTRGPKGESVIEGSPIQYAVTIPQNAPHRKEAIKFLKFLTSPEAQRILEENGHPIYFLLKGDISEDLNFLK